MYSIDCGGCDQCIVNSNSEYISYLAPESLIIALRNIVSLIDKAPQGKYLHGMLISIQCTGQINLSDSIIKYVYCEEILPDKRDVRGYPFSSYSILCAALHEILQLWYTNRQYIYITNNLINCKMIKYSGIDRFTSGLPPVNKTQVATLIELLEICDNVYTSMDM